MAPIRRTRDARSGDAWLSASRTRSVSGPEQENEEETLAVELIESGSEIAGAATGAAVGLVAGPLGVIGGAALGAALGRVLKHVGAEIRQRVLGPREEIRVGAAAAFAGAAIAIALETGRQPRDDGFFETREGGDRPAAEEILEGVLQKARDAYEERKLRLLGLLYANVAFHPEISPQHANHLIALAGQLTYRQLVALAIAHQQAQTGPILRDRPFRGDHAALVRLGLDGNALVTELYGLDQNGLLSDANGEAWISVADVNPGAMRPQPSGSVLAQIMGLDTIPRDDWLEFLERFPPIRAGE